MKIIKGNSDPLGFSIRDNTANFALFSAHATQVVLGLFEGEKLTNEIPMYREKDIWHIGIAEFGKGVEYAYRCEGPPEKFYRPEVWLIDPYAKRVRGGRAVAEEVASFDWGEDAPPHVPREELIIYEMHVRGFTKHSSSKVSQPGTYLGMIEKIPYLKKLGINAVELMPIYGFDPHSVQRTDPKTGQKLVNYWGYSPLHFFFPMDWYASKNPIQEFKMLVKELHKNGIEVLLDVVYNHSGEGGEKCPSVHFRGIDNSVYYLIGHDGKYLNYSGCSNTLNTNHPMVMKLILDSLHYWIEEMHVDGFRFDLASIFTRDTSGKPVDQAPILEAIAKDPVLARVKWIAEAWDAAGLYQLGLFPKWGPWSEWNGQYRDVVRRFIKGTENLAGYFAGALSGSQVIYGASHTPLSSVNFVTAHDGFTLRDLVTYQHKNNLRNGENNRDGNNSNDSWNCGAEGASTNAKICQIRERQMRNFLLALFVSQGIPMLLMGDEYGHTREGNNNSYAQDNEMNWFLWDQMSEKIFNFVSSLIAFRKKHSELRKKGFLTDPEVQWFANWDPHSRFVSYKLQGTPPLFIAFNAHFQAVKVKLPEGKWKKIVDTQEDWNFDAKGSPLASEIELAAHSALLSIRV